MKIVHIIPGSGGSFYCGNCLRDSKFFSALRKQGHDVVKVPMYLPLFWDEHDLEDVPVFYGAVSIYLKQMFPLFRKAPAWFDRLLNTKPLLRYAASKAGSTRAKGLEEMTISMLQGEKGNQGEELERMTEWMRDHFKPDVIHLSNALLLGLAPKIKETLNVPVVCSLQDEDIWVDIMSTESREKVWRLMGENSAHVDRFISVSDYYADVSASKMNISPDKITSIHIGVDPADYEYRNSSEKKRTIGFISRMCNDNGLDILTDAFILLRKDERFNDVCLLLTGGHTGDDKEYLASIKKKLKKEGLIDSVRFHREFDGEGRKDFFLEAAVVSVPVRNGEAFGIYIAESLASGIPVLQPALGAFPEVLGRTGGGIIYGENKPEILSEALANLLDNPSRLKLLSGEARLGAELYLDINKLASSMTSIYYQVTSAK
ncbi:MAG: glycosyltransferase family 4 protein [Bacteroidales bacterium]